MSAASDERRVFGLDLFRATAIACVVLAHGGLQSVLFNAIPHVVPPLGDYAIWATLVGHGGVIGVELFFVLSGFLIGGILLRSAGRFAANDGLPHFYSRRWFRTLPLFWLALAANVIFERLLHDRALPVADIASHGFFLRNFAHVTLTFFPESWSLAVEEWFYLLFPAALWLALRLTGARFDRAFLACAAAFFVFSAAMRAWGAGQPGAHWAAGQRCTVIYRFDALMTGVIAAWLAQRFPDAWRRRALACGIAGLAGSAAVYATFWIFKRTGPIEAENSLFAETFRFNLLSLSFALLLPFASTWAPARENFAHATVRRIALWSYALYLVHWPLFQLCAVPRFAALQQSWGGATAFYVAKILVAVAISALLFRYYESPCTRLRERLGFRRVAIPQRI